MQDIIINCLLLLSILNKIIFIPVNQVATGFENFPDTKMDGGTAQPNLNFAACQDNCRTNTACVGFDWDPNGNPNCWHLLEPPQKDLTQSIDGPGITHYQKVNSKFQVSMM